jgi:hypothetical protein
LRELTVEPQRSPEALPNKVRFKDPAEELQESAPRVILEGVGASNVPDHRPWIAVPTLIHDAGEIRAAFGCCRDGLDPLGVCPEGRGIGADCLC